MVIEIDRVHRRFDRLDERVQVVPVRHIRSCDGRKNVHRDLASVEQLRPRSRNPVRSLDDHGEERQTCIDGDAECALFERERLTRDAAGAFWKHKKGIATLSANAHSVHDGLSRGRSGCAIDLDDADRSHRPSEKGNPEDLLFGEEPAFHGQGAEQQWDVVQGKMVRDHHISLIGVNIFGSRNRHLHRWYPQKHVRPMTNDAVMQRRHRSEGAVHNDDRRQCKGVDEEQRHKHHGADACDDGFDHRVSVDLMIGVYVCGR